MSARIGERTNAFSSVSVPFPFLTSRPPVVPRSVFSVKSSSQVICTKLFVRIDPLQELGWTILSPAQLQFAPSPMPISMPWVGCAFSSSSVPVNVFDALVKRTPP